MTSAPLARRRGSTCTLGRGSGCVYIIIGDVIKMKMHFWNLLFTLYIKKIERETTWLFSFVAAQNSGVALCRASNTFTPTCSFIFIQPTPTSAFCNLIVCKQGRLASIFMVLVQRIFSYKHMEHKELPCLFVLLNLFRISFILSGSVPVRRDFKGPTN